MRPGSRPAARPRTAHAPAKRAPPKTTLLLAIGGGGVVVGALAFFFLHGKSSGGGTNPPTASAPDPEVAPKEPASDPAKRAAAVPAPTPAPAAPPPKPKLDAAAVDAKLAEITTAADALAFGDTVKGETGDAALVDRCYAKALALDPENGDAKKRLDVRPFDPARDLPDWNDLATSKITYRMKAFTELVEQPMTRPERQKQLDAWNAAKAGFAARVALDDKDPYFERLDGTLNGLRDKAWFKDLDYEIVDTTKPYALIVQVAGDAAARKRRVEAVEHAYAPYLAAYDKKVHDWLLPLSPRPPKVDPTFVTWILLDVANYDKYYVEAAGMTPMPGIRAHYEPHTKRAITYSPVVDRGNPEFIVGAQSLLHELTHAWVDRIASFDDGKTYTIDAIQTHWFSEGIAEYMSCQFMDKDGKVHFQPWRSMRVDEAAHKKLRIPFKRALTIRTPGDLQALADDYAREASSDPKQQFIAHIQLGSGFYADMSLFICWLAHADHGASRERFESYVQDELRGEGDGAFDKRFGTLLETVDLEKTIDEFAKRVASGAESFDEE